MTHPCRALLLLLLVAPAAGCITTSPEQQAQRINDRCVARGYKPGTDEFKDCLVRVEGESSQRMQARHRDEVERSAAPSLNRGY